MLVPQEPCSGLNNTHVGKFLDQVELPVGSPRKGTGMAYKDALPLFFPGLWAPYPEFVILFSFHLKLVCKSHFT